MLKLTIPATESFDYAKEEFIYTDELTLEFEHSLLSLSKWEQSFEKPFLGPAEKTPDEMLAYIQAMCFTPDVPIETLKRFTGEQFELLNQYINSPQSATWFNETVVKPASRGREVITAEIIYYWIFANEIPIDCQSWHLNRLFTQLKVFEQKNAPPKKMGKADAIAQRNMLNAKRKAEMKTSG
jgi:hypothetical protein